MTVLRFAGPAQDIVRIISVTDTRQYVEQGDRWVPVPGSGDVSICERCTREHEVHALVELASGKSAIVGTTCARAGTMVNKRLRAAASAAKRLRQLGAEREALQKRLVEVLTIDAEVNALALPPLETAPAPLAAMPERVALWHGDGGPCYAMHGAINDERRQCAEANWRRQRAVERGRGAFEDASSIKAHIEDLDDKIARTEKATRNIAIA